MKEGILDTLDPLCPLDFFAVSVGVKHAKTLPSSRLFRSRYLLPDTSDYLNEQSFADVSLAWNEEGLMVHVDVNQPFAEARFPDFQEGDSLELFFDTRDLKDVGFMTKFCHHFLILPKEVQQIGSHEITRFRTEDSHPLCSPSDLIVETEFSDKSYHMDILISKTCLHGYDPASFNRLGFTYRLNRTRGRPQHFAVSSLYYAIDKHPRLWATINLER
jgi:hypothetical protein